jgi:hypothetical protein
LKELIQKRDVFSGYGVVGFSNELLWEIRWFSDFLGAK